MTNLLTSGAFVLSLFGQPVYAQTEPIPIPIVETIEQNIYRIADEYKISSTTLYNLINSESSLDPNALGDMEFKCPVGANKGLPVRARGLVALTDCYHPEITDAEAFDPDFAIAWGAKQIADKTAWKEFTVCNCYSYARTQIKGLPAMKDIQPNTPYPVVGGLLIEYFNGQKHVSVITGVSEKGQAISQTNKKPCAFSKELRPWNNPNREGYWRSPDSI